MPPAVTPSRLERRIAALGGPSTKTILVAVGDSIRRPSDASSARPDETERALVALSPADVTTALRGVDATSCRAALARAGEDAFEAAFAESSEDRALFASAALDGLAVRDAIASMGAAARQKLALMRGAATDVAAAGDLEAALTTFTSQLATIDAQNASIARRLTGINAERRTELGRLSADLREEAWWYAARSEDDALLAVLGGEAAPGDASAELRADLARSSAVIAQGAGGRH
jgi:hypothetical protein